MLECKSLKDMPLFFRYNIEGTKAFFFKVYKYKVGDKIITREADVSEKKIEMITAFVAKINALAKKHKLDYELVLKESAQVPPEIMKIAAFEKFKGLGQVPILSITKTDKKAKDMDIAKLVRKLCYDHEETIKVKVTHHDDIHGKEAFLKFLSTGTSASSPKKSSPKATPKKSSAKATPKKPSPKTSPKKKSPKALPKKKSPKCFGKSIKECTSPCEWKGSKNRGSCKK